MSRQRAAAAGEVRRRSALTIGRKLSLLCLAFALPVITLLGFFVSDRQQIRATTQDELHSARSLEPLRLLRHDLTVARSLAVPAASGDVAARTLLKAAENRIDDDFRRMLATSGGDRIGDLQRLSRRWETLAAQPLQPTFTDSSYQALLNQLAAYTQNIGSSSPVIRDQQQAAFWLGQALVRTLPALDALRTRLVDTADAAARRGSVAAHERVELQALSTQLDTLLNDTTDAYQRSGQEPAFRIAVQALLSAHQAILDDVKFNLVDVASPYLPVTELQADSSRAEDASLALWTLSSRIFQQELRTRINRLDRDTRTAIVITLAVVGITLLLATAVIRSIRRPLRRAAEVARRISEGDITAELPAERSDEIGVMLHAMRDVLSELQERAFTDALTGLPNRSAFSERVERALAERLPGKGVALLFVDIDHFKQINDVMGHACGDALLEGIAERLRSAIRPTDFVARFGGDEFTILLEDLASVDQAVQGAERIARELRGAFALQGRELFVTASVGVGYTTDPETLPGDLLREADVALYRSKTDGRDRHTIFVEAMTEGALELLHLESDLRRAIDNDQLRLDLQPIVALNTGEVVGAEALIRWQRPGHGLIPPKGFVPVAEANGLIQPIGIWALHQACLWARERTLRFPGTPLFISVNLSPRQIHLQDLAGIVARTLAETGLPADQLRLEITETAVMQDEDEALTVLSSLRDLGVQLLIDDFGTGYSTLRALQQLPLDGIKIDMSFIQGVEHDPTKQVLVKSIIDMAAALRLNVVAEGVEEAEQHRFLRDAACQLAQGFLYSQPLSTEDFDAWLSARDHVTELARFKSGAAVPITRAQ